MIIIWTLTTVITFNSAVFTVNEFVIHTCLCDTCWNPVLGQMEAANVIVTWTCNMLMLLIITILASSTEVFGWIQLPSSPKSSYICFCSDRQTVGELTPETMTTPFAVLGVCGSIGSGKSTVCKMLVSEFNFLAHIDSDSIAHSVYEPNSQVIDEIVDAFGSDILLESGEVDRKKLGSLVFSDPSNMKRLENIVWPHVKSKVIQQIEIIGSSYNDKECDKTPIIILEAAVLLDANWNDIVDGVWVVTSPRSVALQRLQKNRGLTVEDAEKRLDAQSFRRGIGNLDEEVNNGVVSAVIFNEGSLDGLKACLKEKIHDPSAWYQYRQ